MCYAGLVLSPPVSAEFCITGQDRSIVIIPYLYVQTRTQLYHIIREELKGKRNANQKPRLNNSRPNSPLRRTLMLELLLRRRCARLSIGSAGLNPLARACRLRISVKLTTPSNRPDRRAPDSADAGIDVASVADPGCGDVWGIGKCGLLLGFVN